MPKSPDTTPSFKGPFSDQLHLLHDQFAATADASNVTINQLTARMDLIEDRRIKIFSGFQLGQLERQRVDALRTRDEAEARLQTLQGINSLDVKNGINGSWRGTISISEEGGRRRRIQLSYDGRKNQNHNPYAAAISNKYVGPDRVEELKERYGWIVEAALQRKKSE